MFPWQNEDMQLEFFVVRDMIIHCDFVFNVTSKEAIASKVVDDSGKRSRIKAVRCTYV